MSTPLNIYTARETLSHFLKMLFHFILRTTTKLHFTDKESKIQGEEMMCPR